MKVCCIQHGRCIIMESVLHTMQHLGTSNPILEKQVIYNFSKLSVIDYHIPQKQRVVVHFILCGERSMAGFIKCNTIPSWAPIGLLMYEQSIELDAFFQGKIIFLKDLAKNHI